MIPGSESSIENFFENGLSGVRLHIVGSLVDFDFVCWCLRVSLRGVRQTNKSPLLRLNNAGPSPRMGTLVSFPRRA